MDVLFIKILINMFVEFENKNTCFITCLSFGIPYFLPQQQ